MSKGTARRDRAMGPHRLDRATRGRWALGWRSFLFSIAATIVMAAAPTLPGFTTDASAQRLVSLSASKRTLTVTVSVGKSEDVRTDVSFNEILVSDADIADVNPLTDRSLSILGKKLGTTRVSIYGENKRLLGIFDVEVAYETAKLGEEIARRFPAAKIKVSSINGRIMLSGTAPDGAVVDKAMTIARQFGPDVINSIAVDQPQQVMLEVRFVEAARQASRELGVQWNVFNSHSTANIGSRLPAASLPLTGPASPTTLSVGEVAAGVLSNGSPFGAAVARMITGGSTIDVLLNALEERGLARRLAEPNLVALSGDTASFLAGGEYPIPVPGQFSQIAIDYKRYGVSLAFTPTVLSAGLINMKIEPEVSQIDPSHSVSVGQGIIVPALTVRRASTTVELRDGQSFMLAGLLQNEASTLQQQLPWLGDVPVLGALFSSKSYQKNETDLVIIVTPRIVRPTRPGDLVKTPLDNTVPANDIDFFLKNKNEIRREEVRAEEGPSERPFVGHVLDLPKGGDYAAAQ